MEIDYDSIPVMAVVRRSFRSRSYDEAAEPRDEGLPSASTERSSQLQVARDLSAFVISPGIPSNSHIAGGKILLRQLAGDSWGKCLAITVAEP